VWEADGLVSGQYQVC